MNGVSIETAAVVLEAQRQRAQAVVGRMAEWCTRVKTWCVGVLGALGGLTAALAALAQLPAGVAWLLVIVVLAVGLVIVLGAWLLDAYYLHLERHFRPGHEHPKELLVRVLTTGDTRVPEADWRAALTLPPPPHGLRASWPGIRAAALSLAVVPFYGALLVLLSLPATVLLILLVSGHGAR